ncbi:hypothetical protein JCM8097_004351, partial [Rhodosporidiobolus ruineniae]
VEVPKWIMLAMEGAASHDDGEADGRRRTAKEERAAPSKARSSVVGAAVGLAKVVKASPIPGAIFSAFQAVLAFFLYLDLRLSLHQRFAAVLTAFFEGLVEIEREVGIMRHCGDWMSIGWEATVRGIIAFARSEPAHHPSRQPTPVHMHHPELRRTPSGFFGSSDKLRDEFVSGYGSAIPQSYSSPHLHQPYASEPGYTFGQPHLEVPHAHGAAPGMDYSGHTSSSSSSSGHTTRAPRAPSLRRTTFSSPTLQTAYLSSPSTSTSPTFSSSDSLPPYFTSSSVDNSPRRTPTTRTRAPRQRSVSGPDGRRGLGHEASAGTDSEGEAGAVRPGAGYRGGSWAGKVAFGLAERMKVL